MHCLVVMVSVLLFVFLLVRWLCVVIPSRSRLGPPFGSGLPRAYLFRFAKRCPPSVGGLECFQIMWMCDFLVRNVPKNVFLAGATHSTDATFLLWVSCLVGLYVVGGITVR